jgi:para-aminobenzoate synthetase component 1
MQGGQLMTLQLKDFSWSGDAFSLYNFLLKKELLPKEDAFLLDSSKTESPYSNYSIFGITPLFTVKYESGNIYRRDHQTGFYPVQTNLDLFDYLKTLMAEYPLHNPTDLPFVGGAIGYFGYDLSRDLETLPVTTVKAYDIPDSYFAFYDSCLIYDIKNHKVTVSHLGLSQNGPDIDTLVNTLKEAIQTGTLSTGLEADALNTPQEGPVFTSTFTKDKYMDAIQSMRQYIEDGHIYISNMTHQFSSPYRRDPFSTYAKLRTINPAPFAAYLPTKDFQVLSSSPERFMDIRKGHVQTRPIKGTVPRGQTPEEDQANRLRLEASEKDKSELLMIVDLERNDLSRVCQPGTVQVTELFKTEQYATVYHLVSTIEGQLKEGNTALDCIKASFPGGSITGAPKIRAMEIIDELEHNHRGIYTGSIGYLGFDGNADFNIVIRTVVLQDQKAHIGVGGGITWESDPASEYQETIDKAVALFKALDATYKDVIE